MCFSIAIHTQHENVPTSSHQLFGRNRVGKGTNIVCLKVDVFANRQHCQLHGNIVGSEGHTDNIKPTQSQKPSWLQLRQLPID